MSLFLCLTCDDWCPLCHALKISYAIGVSHPLSISVFHYGTSNRDEDELLQIVQKNFDLRPGVIVKYVQFILVASDKDKRFFY